MYTNSINDPEKFWKKYAQQIDWITPFSDQCIKKINFSKENLEIKWFYDGELNVSYNCLDRHLTENANKTAIIWEGDNPEEHKNISYAELHKEVCLMGNVLKNIGVKKGDRVTIYMP